VGVVLKAEPDWRGAAQALVSALEAQPFDDGRDEVIEACRAELGDHVYPAFIKLLAAVARFAEPAAQRLVARALGHALLTAQRQQTLFAASDGLPHADLRDGGPVEFLCLWLHRDVADEPLSDEAFLTAATLTLELLEAAPEAAELYRGRLLADLEHPVEGLHTAASRRAVHALVEAWSEGAAPAEAAQRALAVTLADREASRWGLAPDPPAGSA
jgi:hypothetical protein